MRLSYVFVHFYPLTKTMREQIQFALDFAVRGLCTPRSSISHAPTRFLKRKLLPSSATQKKNKGRLIILFFKKKRPLVKLPVKITSFKKMTQFSKS